MKKISDNLKDNLKKNEKDVCVKTKPSRPLKENASIATIEQAKSNAARILQLYAEFYGLIIKDWREVDMNDFWIWLLSHPRYQDSTKNHYARSVRRTLNIKQSNSPSLINERKRPHKLTEDIFTEVTKDLMFNGYRNNNKTSILAPHIFATISVTGLSIEELSDASLLNIKSNNDASIHEESYSFSIELTSKRGDRIINFRKVPEFTAGLIQEFINSKNIFNNMDPEEAIKLKKACIYHINKYLEKYGHTFGSARKIFPSTLGYLVK